MSDRAAESQKLIAETLHAEEVCLYDDGEDDCACNGKCLDIARYVCLHLKSCGISLDASETDLQALRERHAKIHDELDAIDHAAYLGDGKANRRAIREGVGNIRDMIGTRDGA